jgi:glucoamylase
MGRGKLLLILHNRCSTSRSSRGGKSCQSLGQTSTSYSTETGNLLCFLQVSVYMLILYFISPYRLELLELCRVYYNSNGGRFGKDCNTVLASMHTYDVNAGCDATTNRSDESLSSLNLYQRAFIASTVAFGRSC